MTPTDALELPVRSARDVAEHYIARCAEWPVADFRLDEDQCEMVCRALLSLSSRLERYERIVVAARGWRKAKCSKLSGCGDPNDGRADGTHDWQCSIDEAENELRDATRALDADPVTGSGGEGGR
jgi:hypothetical protein